MPAEEPPTEPSGDGGNDSAGASTSAATGVALSSGGLGAALRLSDEELVNALRLPPKQVATLRTRDGFRRFFAGMPKGRVEGLLARAYEGGGSEGDKRAAKRLALVVDVLVPYEA